jgi:hypothetical protein
MWSLYLGFRLSSNKNAHQNLAYIPDMALSFNNSIQCNSIADKLTKSVGQLVNWSAEFVAERLSICRRVASQSLALLIIDHASMAPAALIFPRC